MDESNSTLIDTPKQTRKNILDQRKANKEAKLERKTKSKNKKEEKGNINKNYKTGDILMMKENLKLKVVKKESETSLIPPWPSNESVRVVCLSDSHGFHRKMNIPDGDILIHAGDFTDRGDFPAIAEFDAWLGELPHKHKIIVAGNHDTAMDPSIRHLKEGHEDVDADTVLIKNGKVLVNETITVEGISIFGSPYTIDLKERKSWAYMAKNDCDMEKLMKMPRDGVDIVVTHSPPYGVADLVRGNANVGSKSVLSKVVTCNPGVHVFGHIHEGGGIYRVASRQFNQPKYPCHHESDREGDSETESVETRDVRTMFVNAASLNSTRSRIRTPVVLDISRQNKEVLYAGGLLEKFNEKQASVKNIYFEVFFCVSSLLFLASIYFDGWFSVSSFILFLGSNLGVHWAVNKHQKGLESGEGVGAQK